MMTIDVIKYLYESLTKNNFDQLKFNKFMSGQTCSIIGGEELYYLCDVKRFIMNEM